MVSLMPLKASSDHKEKNDTPICFLEMAGIVCYF